MKIGIPKEIFEGETRVSIIPESAEKLSQKHGHELFIETNAGIAAGFPNSLYEKAGVKIENSIASLYEKVDIIVKVRKPKKDSNDNELNKMKANSLFLGFFWPLNNPRLAQFAADKKINIMAVDSLPRITRAQSMDALSSQTNLSGYKATIIAAQYLNKIFPLLMTAAGTITPAKILILGAGVAGLQAVATARRLGAVVEVSDVRPSVKEQVESLGGHYIEPPQSIGSGGEGKSGYANEATSEYIQKQKELLERHVANADAIITTALVPGKKAPVLITKKMIENMHAGSVIVDMAAEQGGNCEICKAGEILEHHGVKIIGATNLAASLPYHASQLYSRNVTAILEYFTKEKGKIEISPEDEIMKSCLIVHNGEVVHKKTKELIGN